MKLKVLIIGTKMVVKNENNKQYFNPYEIINDEDDLQENINQGGEAAGAFSPTVILRV